MKILNWTIVSICPNWVYLKVTAIICLLSFIGYISDIFSPKINSILGLSGFYVFILFLMEWLDSLEIFRNE